jgi:hypothetical protein
MAEGSSGSGILVTANHQQPPGYFLFGAQTQTNLMIAEDGRAFVMLWQYQQPFNGAYEVIGFAFDGQSWSEPIPLGNTTNIFWAETLAMDPISGDVFVMRLDPATYETQVHHYDAVEDSWEATVFAPQTYERTLPHRLHSIGEGKVMLVMGDTGPNNDSPEDLFAFVHDADGWSEPFMLAHAPIGASDVKLVGLHD